ncbi:hypothetical protein [Yoonia sp.]|uniref:hypothetical protein n=1 Tax=Yoonia sp. TaxID=2212373 RepID=UPI00344CA3A2
MAAFNEISPNTLMRLIGTPACPVLIDVCMDSDFHDDPYLIPTAFRHPFSDLDGLAVRVQGQDVVVICQQGKSCRMACARDCGRVA